MINKLSEFIKMKRGDMSLREFAKLCGNISHTQIDSIERGIDPRTSKPVRPTVETLSKISKGTGVSVAYLAALANGDEFDDSEKPKKRNFQNTKKPSNDLSDLSKELIETFRQLDEKQKQQTLQFSKFLLSGDDTVADKK